jgi:hypothetical protein
MVREPKAELVRVDSRGEAHPIGSLASQRMRLRTGTFRVLPAPRHVIFMRYTGEDGRRDDADGAIVRLAGEVTAPGTLCDVLALLAQTGWRGELVVEDGESVRNVFFDQGSVVGACTNVEDERIGSVLYRFGALDDAALARVLEACKAGKRFGEAALELGVLTRDSLYQNIQKQIQEIVFATLMVADGTFFFLDGFDDSRLVSHHTLSANALLMDAVTRMDEVKFFHEKIPSSGHIPVRSPNRGEPPQEFAKMYAAVDDRLSVEELGRITGLGEFETTKHVYGLVQSRHVVMHPPRISGGPTAIVAIANGALQEIFKAAESAGLARELRESMASFAVGAGVYEILFRGAGPDESGALDAERVAENAVIVAGGAHPDQVLKQMLHEYVSFALFSSGAALGSGVEATLTRAVAPMLQALHPQS